jgi:chorismate mutase
LKEKENKLNSISNDEHDRYYIIHEDMLPEGMLKTVQAKQLLSGGEVSTIHEAVEQVGLSRSAFYKYKDRVHLFHKQDKQQIVTISMELMHRSGILSNVLTTIAHVQGNVLTIHQTIPLQEKAHVAISLETSMMRHSVSTLIEQLKQLDGVKRVVVSSQSES